MKNTLIIFILMLASLYGCRQDSAKQDNSETTVPVSEEPGVELITPEQPRAGEVIVDNENLKITASKPVEAGSQGGPDAMEIRKLHSAGVQDLKQEKFEEAIADFNQVLELDPDNNHAYYNRGFAYYYLGMYNEADDDFNNAIKYNPNDSTAHLYKGLIKYNQQDFQGAIAEYTEAIRVAPHYADAYYNRGIARGQSGNYMLARKDFSQAISINPNHKNSFFNRGLANYFMGDTVNACRDWQEANALGSANAMEALNAYCK